jgi:DNA helicase-2/ATP-dependent DNA helicase PcrA
VPEELVQRIEVGAPRWTPSYETKNPYARRGQQSYGNQSRTREAAPTYAYEDEDQSSLSGIKLGIRVRHAQFGVGTVVGLEAHGDDYKVTVRFASVGTKKLLASFAKLEKA